MAAKSVKQTEKEETRAAAAKENQPEKKPTAKEIDLNQYITVRNGFHGTLVYVSSRTGETFVWDAFGDEQEMELRELKNAKNASKDFFVNNWFMFDDAWVIEYLGVGQFYRNALSIEGYDDIFSESAASLKKRVKEMSSGQKRNLVFRAHELIENGELDSRKTIAALEEALGVDLIER